MTDQTAAAITVARQACLTVLTDERWALVEPLLPGGPRDVNSRELLNSIRYLSRSGCQWDLSPQKLLPKSTAFHHFAAWREDGAFVGTDARGATVKIASEPPPLPKR